MELLERYLQEIKRHLPQDQQNDIIAEISDDIQNQIEARESELGRPLNVDEEAELIKEYGHPRIVAARYGRQQYLIGPELFPFYRYTVKIVLICVLALELAGVTIAALVSTEPLSTFVQGLAIMWPSVFWSFGVVTIIFAIIERTGAARPVLARIGIDRWNPRTLPAVRDEEIPRFRTLFELIVNAFALFWLLDIPNVRHSLGFLVLGPAVGYLAPFRLTAAWHPFFVVLICGGLMIVAMDFALLVHPEWARLRTLTLTVANTLCVIGACIILPGHSYITAAGKYAVAVPAINEAIFYTLIIFAAGCAIAAVLNLLAFLRKSERPSFNVART